MRVVAYDPYVTTRPRPAARRAAADPRRAARAERLRHDPHAEDARDDRHDRRRAVREDEADRATSSTSPAAASSTRTRCTTALTTGEIAGAGLDVFTSEPPARAARRSRLLDLPNVIVTPHLGASTDEAQEKAGVSVARSVRLALGGELVPDAVNVAGGVIDPYVRPGIPLVEKLGQIFAGLAHSPLTSLDVEVHGELAATT